ncbi:GntR family transcriptional regulator [Mycobacterium hackensackense]|uniref:GntR family transcriptional regulator n=1 Tax=Mycobacterium hackensackense TaxID=228909 RepID=UPI0035576020
MQQFVRNISEALGVGRLTVRAALVRLVDRGLLETRRRLLRARPMARIVHRDGRLHPRRSDSMNCGTPRPDRPAARGDHGCSPQCHLEAGSAATGIVQQCGYIDASGVSPPRCARWNCRCAHSRTIRQR